jgi:hypothetical protein
MSRSYSKSLTNCNGVRYNVALAADRSIANVRREDVQRGVTETWELKGQADFMLMLTHYQINNADSLARDFWLCTE